MSHEVPDLPDVSSDGRAFLNRHRQTGAPLGDAVARGRSRLVTELARLDMQERQFARKKTLLPAEVIGAAALLVSIVTASVLYQRATAAATAAPSTTQPAAEASNEPLRAVEAAYLGGNLDEALSLAMRCATTNVVCARRVRTLTQIIQLNEQFDDLTDNELRALAQLDREFAHESISPVGLRLAHPPTARSRELVSEARYLRSQKRYSDALVPLHKCLELDPDDLRCIKLIATTYAAVATQNLDSNSTDKSRAYFLRYLEVAPPGDPTARQIRTMLGAE